jgi:hypothetical protein
VDINWSNNQSEVLSLAQGLTNLPLASLQGGVSINATVGEPYGSIQGSDFEYVNGKRVINQTNGRYVKTSTTDNVIGNFQPDWKGGINNRFTYKNFNFSFLIDMSKGGDVFSLDTWYGYATGLYDITAGTNELGNPTRDPISAGGGLLLSGVAPDGSPNTVRTQMEVYSHALGYTRAPNALHVYDASFVKLREMTLGYTLPKHLFAKNFIQGLTFTVIGRNLWIIDKNMPYSDPEAGLSSGNVQGYQSGAYPSTKDYGFSIKLEF